MMLKRRSPGPIRRRRRDLNHQALMLEHAADGVLSLDPEGRATFVNPAAAKLTGFTIDELIASPCLHALIHHSYGDGRPRSLETCPTLLTLGDGRVRKGEDIYWRKDGRPFPIEYSVSPIRERGRIAGAVVVFVDISVRKRLETQLDQERRANSLGRMAATIAHEFNNVLMGIQPFAELVRRGTPENAERAAAEILSAVARGRRITQEILRFTQPSEPSIRPVALNDWVADLVPELRNLCGERIDLVPSVPDTRLAALMDSAQMQQVVSNLVLNARDAIDGRGQIFLTVGEHQSLPGSVTITVRDTGAGMTDDVMVNIFEPLFTTKKSGTGLGLAVAQQIVSSHRGNIQVESTPGKGTEFEIRLPRANPPRTDIEPAAERKARSSAPISRLLLVEDESSVSGGLSMLLESENIVVEVASCGAEAVPALERFDADAVILDVGLPDMDGAAVFELIARRWPDLPVIFSTGHGTESSLDEYLTRANVAFLRKPYDFDTLLATLARVTGR